MWFASKEAIEFLNKNLGLPASGDEQDWEIELSNSDDIKKFIRFYNSQVLSEDQKQALIALILASFEDAHWKSKFDEDLWRKFCEIVQGDMSIFDEILEIWAGTRGEESFAITPYVNRLRAQTGHRLSSR